MTPDRMLSCGLFLTNFAQVCEMEINMSILLLIAIAGAGLVYASGLLPLLRSIPRSNDDFQI